MVIAVVCHLCRQILRTTLLLPRVTIFSKHSPNLLRSAAAEQRPIESGPSSPWGNHATMAKTLSGLTSASSQWPNRDPSIPL
jgi:hypothetical protein